MTVLVAVFPRSLGWLLVLLAVACPAARPGRPSARATRPIATSGTGHTLTARSDTSVETAGSSDIGPHRGEGLRRAVRHSAPAAPSRSALAVAHGAWTASSWIRSCSLANRRSGPVQQSVTFAEVALQFNLTGGKTWHRHRAVRRPAAWAGALPAARRPTPAVRVRQASSILLPASAFGSSSASGSTSGSRPGRLLEAEVSRPHSRQEPVEEPGTPTNPTRSSPVEQADEWTSSPWLQAGLGIRFSP